MPRKIISKDFFGRNLLLVTDGQKDLFTVDYLTRGRGNPNAVSL